MNDDVPETVATYLRLRGLKPTSRYARRRRRSSDDENLPFTPGRDPRAIGAALDELSRTSGWTELLARESVVLAWPQIVGEEIARHSAPVSLEHGTLTVKCGSTAWMKQLDLMRVDLLTSIRHQHPDATVDNLRFIGPDVPSWKWGSRAVPGRGPRDTYG